MEQNKNPRFDLPERTEYVSNTVAFLENEAKKAREERMAYTLKTPQSERKEAFCHMLGFPLSPSPEQNEIKVKKELLKKDELVTAYAMQLEVISGVWLYGILLEPNEKKEKNPFAVFQHGGLGTPELISSFVPPTNYHGFARKTAENGVVVFCPQLFHWSVESWGSPYNGAWIDSVFRQLGGSKTAFGVYCIKRAIDYFSALPEIDEDRIGMAGLSYGGMYALVTAAADERIRVTVSSCYLNDRTKYAWNDWSYRDQARSFYDAEVLTLVAPRYIMAEVASRDTVFTVETVKEAEEDYAFYREKLGLGDTCCIRVFEGTHEFAKDDENLRFLLAHL